jgi:hypothetical protein
LVNFVKYWSILQNLSKICDSRHHPSAKQGEIAIWV